MTIRVTVVAALSVVLLLSGCASAFQPLAKTQLTGDSEEQVFNCVNATANTMGFMVTEANKESGFLKAERKTSGIGRVLMTGSNTFDALTSSIYKDPATGKTVLKLTSADVDERAGGFGAGHRNTTKPSKKLQDDIATILSTCAK